MRSGFPGDFNIHHPQALHFQRAPFLSSNTKASSFLMSSPSKRQALGSLGARGPGCRGTSGPVDLLLSWMIPCRWHHSISADPAGMLPPQRVSQISLLPQEQNPTGRTRHLSPTIRGSPAACASPLKPAAFVSLAGWITVTGLLDGAALGPEIAAWTYLGESVKLRLGPCPDQNSRSVLLVDLNCIFASYSRVCLPGDIQEG